MDAPSPDARAFAVIQELLLSRSLLAMYLQWLCHTVADIETLSPTECEILRERSDRLAQLATRNQTAALMAELQNWFDARCQWERAQQETKN